MTATLTRSTLSVAASTVWRIRSDFTEAYEYDSGYDGGEFSGPALARGEEKAITFALTGLGWTRTAYNEAIEERTSAAYVWRMGLDVEDEHRDVFGRF